MDPALRRHQRFLRYAAQALGKFPSEAEQRFALLWFFRGLPCLAITPGSYIVGSHTSSGAYHEYEVPGDFWSPAPALDEANYVADVGPRHAMQDTGGTPLYM